MQDSLLKSLKIQKNIIFALLMREVITRYGRNNLGVLWLFVEPLLVTSVITLMWGFKGGVRSGVSVTEFMLTGYPLMMMWRGAANRCLGAVSANAGLLFHRNIRVLDVYIARVLLEVSGATMAFALLLFGFYFIGFVSAPANLMYMLLAWFLMAWFSFGLGLTIGVLAEVSEMFERVWKALSMVLMFASGAFYLVDSLPKMAQDIALKIPMVHGTEMLRHGYFGNQIKTYEDIGFIVVANVVLLFLGLVLIQRFSQGVEPA